jgi:hypothetical protein
MISNRRFTHAARRLEIRFDSSLSRPRFDLSKDIKAALQFVFAVGLWQKFSEQWLGGAVSMPPRQAASQTEGIIDKQYAV